MGIVTQSYVALTRFYERNPRIYSLYEILLFLGFFVFIIWVVPFWLWGIYRSRLNVPAPVEKFFFLLWSNGTLVIVICLSILAGLLVLTAFVRHDTPKELGIRIDNLWASGRECLVASFIGLIVILGFFSFHISDFVLYAPSSYIEGFLSYPFWGITQQFLLQSVLYVRLYRISGRKVVAIGLSPILFSLLHAPNVPLMTVAFIAGLLATILFSRNRNILTIGFAHGVMAVILSALLIPGAVHNLRFGPIRGNPHLVAGLAYDGSPLVMKPMETITVPIRVENKSTAVWDSQDKKYPVYVSYHLLSEKGDLLVYDNVRTGLDRILLPKETTVADLKVVAPERSGRYLISVDIVKERVDWFENEGSLVVVIPLLVDRQQ